MPSQVDMYDQVPTVPEAKPRVSFDLRDVEALQKSADETAPEWALEIVSSKSRFIIDFGCEARRLQPSSATASARAYLSAQSRLESVSHA